MIEPSIHSHAFNTALAMKYGAEEAIVLNHLIYWIKVNIKKGQNYFDGKHWTYQSQQQIHEALPYFSRKKVGRLVKRLEEKGAIIRANYNPSPMIHTTWYAIKDEQISKNVYDWTDMSKGLPNSGPRLDRSGQTIKDTIQTNTIQTNTTTTIADPPDLLAKKQLVASFNLNLTNREICDICEMSIDEIKAGLQHVTAPNFVVKKSLTGAIIFYGKNHKEIASASQRSYLTGETAYEMLSPFLKDLDGERVNGYRFTFSKAGLSIGGSAGTIKEVAFNKYFKLEDLKIILEKTKLLKVLDEVLNVQARASAMPILQQPQGLQRMPYSPYPQMAKETSAGAQAIFGQTPGKNPILDRIG